jgi:Icc-related predicted phosphoesterase
VTDLHASDRCFRKFLNAAKVYKADKLILGGDVTGKALIPIVERVDGQLQLNLFSQDTSIGRERLEETRKALSDAGQYSFVTTPAEYEEIKADKAKQDVLFNRCMLESINSWIQLT